MPVIKLLFWIRKLRLMQGFDKFYFLFNKIRFNKKNRRFKKEHPLVKLPPDYTMYEAYQLDYENYFNDGNDTAAWIAAQLSDYVSFDDKKILDWGCGPARIVRHLPALLPHSKIYGSDYNVNTITWCKENIPDIEFITNRLEPPFPVTNDFFDIVYALSVFTHLSKQNHTKWMNELFRMIKPGGIFLITTQGNAFLDKLTKNERQQFLEGEIVIRSDVKEGHRSFSAFQPEKFIQSVISTQWRVLKFVQGTIQNWGPEQDTWILEKP